MKKLTILTLILALAASANAMTLQISVDGYLDPVDTEIKLFPSETIMLGIHSPNGYVSGDDVYFALVVDVSEGSMSGGVVTAAAPPDSGIYGYDAQANGLSQPPDDGMWGAIKNIGGTPIDPGIYIDQILYHAESMQGRDVVLYLWSTPDLENFTLQDMLIIHQGIPEPATFALLSLGSLLLLRRRKQNRAKT